MAITVRSCGYRDRFDRKAEAWRQESRTGMLRRRLGTRFAGCDPRCRRLSINAMTDATETPWCRIDATTIAPAALNITDAPSNAAL
jgi:hypothetical protein